MVMSNEKQVVDEQGDARAAGRHQESNQ